MKTYRALSFFVACWLALAACTSVDPTGNPTPTALLVQATPSSRPTSTPASPDAPEAQTFEIRAGNSWDSTGIYLRPGQPFEILVSGSWTDGQGPAGFGPAGGDSFSSVAPLPSVPIGALIGRIGFNPPFLIGDGLSMVADFGGELWLSINEAAEGLFDNDGSLAVSISLGADPSALTLLFTNDLDGYRLLIPADYQAVIYSNSLCLTLAGARMLACHVANAFIETAETAGRTLEQVADETAAQGNPDIPVRRTELTVSGIPAVLLDDIYGVDVMRKVVMVTAERAYTLTFIPWNEELEAFPAIEFLYDTVIRSFSTLDPPQEIVSLPPDANPASQNPAVELRVDGVNVSYSPDGQWKAETLLATQFDPTYTSSELLDYVHLSVFRLDGSQVWSAFEEWSGTGLGDSFVDRMYWSGDGRTLFFDHAGATHPCGSRFVSRLQRFDLVSGELAEIPLTGNTIGNVSISPDVERVVYYTAEGLLVTELGSGSSRLYPYPWPEYSLADNYAWSPDGQALAFNFMENFCDFSGGFRSYVWTLDLETGEFMDHTGEDLPVPLVLGWPEAGRLLGDREGRGYFDLVSGDFTLDSSLEDPVSEAARFLREYLAALFWGDKSDIEFYSYEQAARMYGGSYETLMEMNPDADPDDRASLLRLACEANGFMCLRLREVLSTAVEPREGGAQAIYFTVNLMNPDGSVFFQGPCCGAEASESPESEFQFTVLALAEGGMEVLQLPPYVP